MCEGTIGVESMKLLLGLDCDQGIEDEIANALTSDGIAWHIVCDIIDETGEEGDLEYLVESDEFKAGQGILRDGRWRWCIRQCSLSRDLDGGQLRRWIGYVGETI